jgi:SAM-dependent methyltransferase
MRCLDLGCGGGHVTLEMARLVAPAGSVVGVDMDEVKLELAREAAAEGGANVEFHQLTVRDWDEPGSYDAFLAAGIPGPEGCLVQPVWTRGEGKTLAWSTLEASAGAIVAERVASQAEVTAALTNLWQFTDDPQTLISGPRIFQLWSSQ